MLFHRFQFLSGLRNHAFRILEISADADVTVRQFADSPFKVGDQFTVLLEIRLESHIQFFGSLTSSRSSDFQPPGDYPEFFLKINHPDKKSGCPSSMIRTDIMASPMFFRFSAFIEAIDFFSSFLK